MTFDSRVWSHSITWLSLGRCNDSCRACPGLHIPAESWAATQQGQGFTCIFHTYGRNATHHLLVDWQTAGRIRLGAFPAWGCWTGSLHYPQCWACLPVKHSSDSLLHPHKLCDTNTKNSSMMPWQHLSFFLVGIPFLGKVRGLPFIF